MTTDFISLRLANDYVSANHRHNKATRGHKFSIGCFSDGVLVGVAICGRPVGRKLDNGTNLEVYRVCTLGHKNACSKLYSACIKVAKIRGYHRVYTYTLHSELASSVKASNFKLDCEKAGKPAWNGRTAFKGVGEYKRRWLYLIK